MNDPVSGVGSISYFQEIWQWFIGVPRLVGGMFGGLIAMFLVRDTWPRRLVFALGAIPSAWFGGEPLQRLIGGNEGFHGFICGMFFLAIARRIFDWIDSADVGAMVERVFSAIFKR